MPSPSGAVALAIVALAAAVQQRPSPPFTAGADLIVVPAIVTDRRGALVQGLTAEDFQVFEDGKPVPIETFVAPSTAEAGADGRFIVLVLDNVHTRTELGSRVQTIARKFIDRLVGDDVVSVVTLNAGRSFTTTSKAEARAAIARFRPALGETARGPGEDAAQGLRTITALSQQMSKAPHHPTPPRKVRAAGTPARKVLVFIGAASMFSPQEPSAFSDRGPQLGTPWFDAIRATGTENVSVYTIDPEGHGGTNDDYSQSFAVETGGLAWVNTNNFDAAVDTIWRESASYYLLGYPSPINDHRIHRIEVRVKAPNVRVRARRARG